MKRVRAVDVGHHSQRQPGGQIRRGFDLEALARPTANLAAGCQQGEQAAPTASQMPHRLPDSEFCRFVVELFMW